LSDGNYADQSRLPSSAQEEKSARKMRPEDLPTLSLI
jgi:hypothetical protein